MTLKDVRDLYKSVLPEHSHHYTADGETGNYIVWSEDTQANSIYAEDKMDDRALQGTTDYFTKIEYDPMVNQIETAMNNSDMSWKLNSIQFEKDTGYIHYEWVWEVDDWLE
jgi:hypothetical protein